MTEENAILFSLSERERLRFEIGVIDSRLSSLRMSDQRETHKEDTLEEGVSRLKARRDSLFKKFLAEEPTVLKHIPLGQAWAETDPRFQRGHELRRHTRSRVRALTSSLMPTSATKFLTRALPQRASTEAVVVTAHGFEVIDLELHGLPPMTSLGVWDENSALSKGAVWIRAVRHDPNPDPFSSDYGVGVALVAWWFELPRRSFRAKYDLRLNGSLQFSYSAMTYYWWGGGFGGVHVQGGLVRLEDAPIPIPDPSAPLFLYDEWGGGFAARPLIHRFQFSRSFVANPGDDLRVLLYYGIDLHADRQFVELYGQAQVGGTPRRDWPFMACYITPA